MFIQPSTSTNNHHQQQQDDDDDDDIREIQALTPQPPLPPRRREAWDTTSHRSSSLSVASTETENFTTMSREFNALVLAGNDIDVNEHNEPISNLERIREDEHPMETNPLAIVADNNPRIASPTRRGQEMSLISTSHASNNHSDVSSVKKEEVESKISAWQNAKIAKINNRFKVTTNPEKSLTTQTVNGGGKNPVFNETLRINVPTVESSLKCEIYMLSRVRNYLEDQLLGFALIPLSEVLVKNGKLEKEFTLSSTDLFHSPSGFVDLSLSYTGASPDVIAIPPPVPATKGTPNDSELAEFDKLEFPDPKIANENNMMVTEYFGLSSESLVSSDTDDQVDTTAETPKPDSPPSSVSTNGSHCASGPFKDSKSANQEYESPLKVEPAKSVEAKSDPGNGNLVKKPVVAEKFDLEQKVVQQDFVDLYMKSMQQFTESLAKMKLPLDVEKAATESGDSVGSDQKTQTPTGTQTPNGTQSRVFYGSRAFF